MPVADAGPGVRKDRLGRLPLVLKVAADGLFVQNSAEALRDLIGFRVEALERVPVARLLEDVARRFPTENASGAHHNHFVPLIGQGKERAQGVGSLRAGTGQ